MTEIAIAPAAEQLLEALEALETSHVSDALDSLGINGQCAGLLPLDRDTKLVGTAFTVKYGPADVQPGSVGDYIDDLPPRTVVVLDNGGREDTTVWGDILTTVASRKELAGTVIDGICRDTDTAVELNYPVYSRSRWMRTGKDRVQVEAYDVPVNIGGVRVAPGDLLLGDADGVVAIPLAQAAAVIAKAEEIKQAEDRIQQAVLSGQSLTEARTSNGYHVLQSRTSATDDTEES